VKFYVIYSVDVARGSDRNGGCNLRCCRPTISRYLPHGWRKWQCTEGDESYDYDYLAEEGGYGSEVWRKGQHRKLCALLSREEFERFLEDVSLVAEDCETMGSLTGFGWLPAISFGDDGDHPYAILNAYVTPVPQKPDGEERTGMQERDWRRVRRAIIRAYGY
jgi:hypothetical protein